MSFSFRTLTKKKVQSVELVNFTLDSYQKENSISCFNAKCHCRMRGLHCIQVVNINLLDFLEIKRNSLLPNAELKKTQV